MMTDEMGSVLISRYPKIFDSNFYFEHDDGWFDIIDRGCAIMQNHIDARNKYVQFKKDKGELCTLEEIEQIQCLQSKEKFGGLRFYVSGGDEFCRGVIEMMEKISFTVCEVCGYSGEPRNLSWIKALCDKHYSESTRKI